MLNFIPLPDFFPTYLPTLLLQPLLFGFAWGQGSFSLLTKFMVLIFSHSSPSVLHTQHPNTFIRPSVLRLVLLAHGPVKDVLTAVIMRDHTQLSATVAKKNQPHFHTDTGSDTALNDHCRHTARIKKSIWRESIKNRGGIESRRGERNEKRR